MNLRCKPGDLAIVVNAQNPSNLGLIVRVTSLMPAADDLKFKDDAGPVWVCECAHPMTWTRQGRQVSAHRGPIPDRQLQPLRGAGPSALPRTQQRQHEQPVGPR